MPLAVGPVEEFVRNAMSRYDVSHDYLHVDRVRRLGLGAIMTNGLCV